MASGISEAAEPAPVKAALARLWRERQYQEAASLAAKAMELWPQEPAFGLEHAKSLLAAGALPEAEAAARAALATDASAAEKEEIWLILTDSLIRQERQADGREALREACFAQPESVALQGRRGHQAMLAKDYAETIDAYQIACDLAPEREALHHGLLGGLWHAKRYALGGAAAERAVQLMPQSAALRQQLASFLLAEGRAVDAAEVARQAIELDPSNTAAHWALVDALWRQDRFREAFRTLEAACDLLPSNIYLLQQLARLSVAMERRDAVIRAYQRAVSLPEMPPEIWGDLIRALIEHKNLEEASVIARRAMMAHPAVSDLGVALVKTLLLQGWTPERAEAEIVQFTGTQAGDSDARHLIISGLLALERWEEATSLLEALRAQQPDQPELMLKFGLALTGKAAFSEAIPLLQDLTEKHPEKLEAWEALCEAHRQAKNIKAALAAYRRLQALGARGAMIQRVQTRLFGEQGI